MIKFRRERIEGFDNKGQHWGFLGCWYCSTCGYISICRWQIFIEEADVRSLITLYYCFAKKRVIKWERTVYWWLVLSKIFLKPDREFLLFLVASQKWKTSWRHHDTGFRGLWAPTGSKASSLRISFHGFCGWHANIYWRKVSNSYTQQWCLLLQQWAWLSNLDSECTSGKYI